MRPRLALGSILAIVRRNHSCGRGRLGRSDAGPCCGQAKGRGLLKKPRTATFQFRMRVAPVRLGASYSNQLSSGLPLCPSQVAAVDPPFYDPPFPRRCSTSLVSLFISGCCVEEVVAFSNPPRGFDEPQPMLGSRLNPPREPTAETIRRRNDHRWSEHSCCCSYTGRRGHEEWRWPDRRSPRNTQFRQNRRNAW
jgi:hypothetical protein